MSRMIPQAFVFIGRSGSGKGTQADLLIKALKEKDPGRETLYIQTGQEFRDFIKGQNFTEKKSAEYYAADKLQPEFLAVHMWVNPLVSRYNGNQHIIFDGTPRKLDEAYVLDSVFDFYGFNKPKVIDLNISAEEALTRLLKRKRLDDAEDDIKKRLAWYGADVAPVIEWYKKNSKYDLLSIDGQRPEEEIHNDIVKSAGLV